MQRQHDRLRAAALGVLLLAAPACQGDGTGSGGTPAHLLGFTYAGDQAGSFQVSGPFPGPIAADGQNWVVGVDFTGFFGPGEFFGILGHRAVSADVSHVFTLVMDRPGRSEIVCDALRVQGGGCAFDARFSLGLREDPATGGQTADADFFLVSGRMQLTTEGSERLAGSFSFRMGTIEGDTIDVTGGSFDVARLDPDDFGSLPGASRIPLRLRTLER